MDDGIFGKVMIDYYWDNYFVLLGMLGVLFSNVIRIHDIYYVFVGYLIILFGEICVFVFDGVLMNVDFGKVLIGYVVQF